MRKGRLGCWGDFLPTGFVGVIEALFLLLLFKLNTMADGGVGSAKPLPSRGGAFAFFARWLWEGWVLCWRMAGLHIILSDFWDALVVLGPGKPGHSCLDAAQSLRTRLQGCSNPWAQPHRQPPCLRTILGPHDPTGIGPVGVQPHFGVRFKFETGGCWETS